MSNLEDLNAEWQGKKYAHAVKGDPDWTMSCPSCRMVVGDGKISLIDALNRAVVHRRKGCNS